MESTPITVLHLTCKQFNHLLLFLFLHDGEGLRFHHPLACAVNFSGGKYFQGAGSKNKGGFLCKIKFDERNAEILQAFKIQGGSGAPLAPSVDADAPGLLLPVCCSTIINIKTLNFIIISDIGRVTEAFARGVRSTKYLVFYVNTFNRLLHFHHHYYCLPMSACVHPHHRCRDNSHQEIQKDQEKNGIDQSGIRGVFASSL